MKKLIIIPVYNEESSIRRVVENLEQNYPEYDYIVVNDCSTDNTKKLLQENEYYFLDLPVNLGLSGAFQTGMLYAYENGYDYALQYDGDGQHRAEYIENLFECALSTGANIVIGSRFIDRKKPKNLRMLGSSLISLLIKITSGTNISDPTSGMRLYDKSIIKEYAMNIDYTPEPDTIVFLIRNGIVCKEVQIEIDDRMSGESYLNFKNAFLYMVKVIVSITFLQWVRRRRL